VEVWRLFCPSTLEDVTDKEDDEEEEEEEEGEEDEFDESIRLAEL